MWNLPLHRLHSLFDSNSERSLICPAVAFNNDAP
jgi:hypothetical protein